jgi:UDP-N-acetylglucosamine--N-acetylmuramyl-(pentapeptide) pyrophosphoryl-undecaprenol N-acetylglucosamine transferase
MEARLAPADGFEIEWFEIGGLNRVGWRKAASTLLQLPAAIVRALGILKRHSAVAVFSMGGYVAGPVVAAAILSRIPIVAMEPNAMPGLVSRLTARWVRHALVSFDETLGRFPAGRAERSGLPVRDEFFGIPPAPAVAPFHVLITGGSRGASSLNRAARESWQVLGESPIPISVTLQCGQAEAAELEAAFESSGVAGEVTAFIDDMAAAYGRASLVVSRSGAGAVSEIAAAGRPSILVPFPFAADDHQKHNALAMVRAGASVMIEDSEISGARLAGEIVRIASGPAQAAAMGVNARAMAHPGAARRAADLLERCAGIVDSAEPGPKQ